MSNAGPAQRLTKPVTKDEYTTIREAEDEFRRRGHFKRIFPCMDYNYYKQFFLHGERSLNQLLDDRIMEKRRMRTYAVMQGIKKD